MRGANRGLGGCRAGSGGGTITAGTGSGVSPARPGDGRRLTHQLLVEDALGLRLGQGVLVGYGLDERLVPTGRPAGRAVPRRACRLARLAGVVESRCTGGASAIRRRCANRHRSSGRPAAETRTGVRAAWPTGSGPGTGHLAPRQRVVKPRAVVVGNSGPHRARKRWRRGIAAHWMAAPCGSGGGAYQGGGIRAARWSINSSGMGDSAVRPSRRGLGRR